MKDRTKLGNRSFATCHICGDVARGLNFNVITCVTCKAFFRRNAFKRSIISKCEFENDCKITKQTRSYCSPCRLKKCFALGMDPKLIRTVPRARIASKEIQQPIITEDKQIALSTPWSLSLLRNDRSTLTSAEWNLLSNCLHAYDEHNPSIRIQNSLNQISSLPHKLRLKRSDTVNNIISQFFTCVQPLIERSQDLYSLPTDARRALAKHNLYSTGAVNGVFICRELDLYNNMVFSDACDAAYGGEYMIYCARNSSRYDPNASLIKIMIFVLSCSSNCSIVNYDIGEDISTMSSSIFLIHIQNIYVTMLWKYLVYSYGFTQAVLRFASLVKSVIDAIHMLELMPTNETHDHMVDSVVTETERLLMIEN